MDWNFKKLLYNIIIKLNLNNVFKNINDLIIGITEEI